MDTLSSSARRTAVGMAAHASSGREDEANLLLHLYLREARDQSVLLPVALVVLVKTLTSMSVAAVSNAGASPEEVFGQMASNVVAVEP